MSHLIVRFSSTVLLLGLLAGPAWAIDVITRKGAENRLSGEVTDVSKTEVTLKPLTGPDIKIPANEIELIEWDGAPATIRAANGQESGGSYEAALGSYQTVLEEIPVTEKYIRTDLQFFVARTLAKIAMADNSRLTEAIARMKAFTDSNPSSFRYFEAMDYLGRLYLAASEYEKAQAAFTLIERGPFNDWKLAAQSAKARVMLAQGNVDQALQAFDTVLKSQASDAASQQRLLEAKLGKGACLNLKNQYSEALTLLADVIAQADENDASLQSEAQIHRGAALLGQGKNQEALMAYLLIDILFSGQGEAHAEALYNLAKLWPTLGQPGRAEEARANLETKYPTSPWTKKLSGG